MYSVPALVAVVAGFVAAVGTVVGTGPPRALAGLSTRSALVAPAVVVLVAPLVWAPQSYARGPWLTVSHLLAGLAAGTGVATLLPAVNARRGAFAVPAALALAAGAAMIRASPRPGVDVWYLLQESTDGLLGGDNLYRQSWPGSPGLVDTYPYLPWTSVVLLPARLVTGDVRYGLLAALLVAALAARALAGDGVPALLPLLLLLAPKLHYAVEQSWTEPLLVACLGAAVLAADRDRPGWAVVALALALASKQHVALLLPLTAWWPQIGPRRMLIAAGLAGLAVLPWWLASPADFWADAVRFNLGQPVLERGLTLPALALRAEISLSFVPMLVALSAAYVLALRRAPRDATGFCLGGALVLWTLDLFNKQSFFNHYTLPLGLLVLAVAARTNPSSRVRRGRAPTSRTARASAGPAAWTIERWRRARVTPV